MPSRIHTFFFGRFNILGVWEDKRTFIFDGLSTDELEQRGKFKYGFFEIEEIVFESQLFVFGRLVKYKPLLEGEIVDEDRHELSSDGLPYGVVAKSEFILHYKSGVIAFRPVSNRLSASQFRDIFAALFEATHHKFFVDAEVESVDEDLAIEEAFTRFRTISRVSVDLHPTNPSNREIYDRVAKRLKRLQAKRLRQTVEASENSDGLNRDELREDDTYRGLLMAVDGYGRGYIQGVIDEGRKVTIYTDDSPVKKEVIPSEDPTDVLHQLIPVFRRIWDRLANNRG